MFVRERLPSIIPDNFTEHEVSINDNSLSTQIKYQLFDEIIVKNLPLTTLKSVMTEKQRNYAVKLQIISLLFSTSQNTRQIDSPHPSPPICSKTFKFLAKCDFKEELFKKGSEKVSDKKCNLNKFLFLLENECCSNKENWPEIKKHILEVNSSPSSKNSLIASASAATALYRKKVPVLFFISFKDNFLSFKALMEKHLTVIKQFEDVWRQIYTDYTPIVKKNASRIQKEEPITSYFATLATYKQHLKEFCSILKGIDGDIDRGLQDVAGVKDKIETILATFKKNCGAAKVYLTLNKVKYTLGRLSWYLGLHAQLCRSEQPGGKKQKSGKKITLCPLSETDKLEILYRQGKEAYSLALLQIKYVKAIGRILKDNWNEQAPYFDETLFIKKINLTFFINLKNSVVNYTNFTLYKRLSPPPFCLEVIKKIFEKKAKGTALNQNKNETVRFFHLLNLAYKKNLRLTAPSAPR